MWCKGLVLATCVLCSMLRIQFRSHLKLRSFMGFSVFSCRDHRVPSYSSSYPVSTWAIDMTDTRERHFFSIQCVQYCYVAYMKLLFRPERLSTNARSPDTGLTNIGVYFVMPHCNLRCLSYRFSYWSQSSPTLTCKLQLTCLTGRHRVAKDVNKQHIFPTTDSVSLWLH